MNLEELKQKALGDIDRDYVTISEISPHKLLKLISRIEKQEKVIEEMKLALTSIASVYKKRHAEEEYWLKIEHEHCATVLATDTKIARECLSRCKEMGR